MSLIHELIFSCQKLKMRYYNIFKNLNSKKTAFALHEKNITCIGTACTIYNLSEYIVRGQKII